MQFIRPIETLHTLTLSHLTHLTSLVRDNTPQSYGFGGDGQFVSEHTTNFTSRNCDSYWETKQDSQHTHRYSITQPGIFNSFMAVRVKVTALGSSWDLVEGSCFGGSLHRPADLRNPVTNGRKMQLNWPRSQLAGRRWHWSTRLFSWVYIVLRHCCVQYMLHVEFKIKKDLSMTFQWPLDKVEVWKLMSLICKFSKFSVNMLCDSVSQYLGIKYECSAPNCTKQTTILQKNLVVCSSCLSMRIIISSCSTFL